jgi:chemotaxis family two-component system response regulator Rcp1
VVECDKRALSHSNRQGKRFGFKTDGEHRFVLLGDLSPKDYTKTSLHVVGFPSPPQGAKPPSLPKARKVGIMTQSENGDLKPVVLHVEDSDATAYLLRYALREQKADVDVFRLCDGEDAILYLARTGVFVEAPRPTVIVLDLELPKKHGHEILAEIRKEASLRHVPVIVFSSSVRAADREKALALGANHYVYKTGDLETFTALSRQILAYLPPTLAPVS